MFFRAPRGLPSPQYIFDDLHCIATPAQIAKYLDLTPPTIERYIKTSNLPRSVHLALFWETKWGRSCVDVDLYNDAQYSRAAAQSYQARVVHLCGVIDKMERELDKLYQDDSRGGRWQAANAALWRVG